MKVVVIGGTGLIGSKVTRKLKEKGHEVIVASPSTGINAVTGEGLDAALRGADVVVDVSNSPSFEDQAVFEFFDTSTRHLLKAEQAAGVKHHVALSVVGTDLLPDSGYFRAKLAQEKLIQSSSVPYTIVRATQFFEFLNSIIQGSTSGETVVLPTAFIQPIAAEDVAEALFQAAVAEPKKGTLDIAGPERFRFAEIAKKYLQATKSPLKVDSQADAKYFGSKLKETTLVPQAKADLGAIDFEAWFKTQNIV